MCGYMLSLTDFSKKLIKTQLKKIKYRDLIKNFVIIRGHI